MIKKELDVLFIDTQETLAYLKENFTNFKLRTFFDIDKIDKSIFKGNIDIVLVEIDFFKNLSKSLKDEFKELNIPIIITMNTLDEEYLLKIYGLYELDFILKPLNFIELKVKLNNLIKLSRNDKKNRADDFLSQVSHQWKQPLTQLSSINTYYMAQLELEAKLNEEELYENLEKSNKILRFMSDTLDTFRNFYDSNSINDRFKLIELINLPLKILESTLKHNHIDLKIIEKKKDIKVLGNLNELSQVILTILSNARDVFILRGIKNRSICITLDEFNQKPIITIEDNGGGIRLKNREDIFLPFVSHTKSSGIGLYIAKTILSKYDGKIDVNNTEQGAIFKISL